MDRVLIIDDEPSVVNFLSILLQREGYEVITAGSGPEALKKFRENPADVVLVDLKMPEMDGLQVLSKIKSMDNETPVIIMTAYASIESAIEAMRKGAFDYVMKPFKVDEIALVVKRALQERKLILENIELKRKVKQYEFQEMVGQNEKFREVLQMVMKVAPTDSTVLISGESGTGKELIARAIHNLSQRSNKQFLAINMAALPEELLESELFGYVKGAFTGAIKDKEGLLKVAEGGTVLLDEISEASPRIQVKILRALQEREITPVGSTRVEKINVRIIAATNTNLEEKVEEGKFREDLFYRLNVVNIHLPPLRERKDDIPLLVNFFIKKYSRIHGLEEKKFSKATMELLMKYDWPGNIRELENVVERALILSDGPEIGPEDLPPKVRMRLPIVKVSSMKGLTLEELERQYILQVLSETAGNKAKAAKILGIDPSTLYRKLHRYKQEKAFINVKSNEDNKTSS